MNLLFSCIGRRGYIAEYFRPHLEATDRIIGTGNTRWTPGFEACDVACLLPDLGDDDYIPAVLELCEREHIDAVLSFLDPDVHRLAQAQDELRVRGVLPLLPSAEVVDITFDKYRFFEFLAHKGIPTPRTVLSPNEVRGLGYPLFVKPRRGSGSLHTFVAHSQRELEVFYDYAPDMIVQEAVEGEEINIELCGDLSGSPIGISTWRKYRSRLGETEQAETFRDPDVVDFGLHLGGLIGAVGPMDVDVVRLPNGVLVVLEANTRFGGGYPVSHLAGADFPKLLLELVKHGTARPHLSFEPGVVMMKRLDPVGGRAESFFQGEMRLR